MPRPWAPDDRSADPARCSPRAPEPQPLPGDRLARAARSSEARRARRLLLPGGARTRADPRLAHRSRCTRQGAADREAAAYLRVRQAVTEAPQTVAETPAQHDPHDRER